MIQSIVPKKTFLTRLIAGNVVSCVLTKVGKPNRGSGKHKGVSRDFRKTTPFKL